MAVAGGPVCAGPGPRGQRVVAQVRAVQRKCIRRRAFVGRRHAVLIKKAEDRVYHDLPLLPLLPLWPLLTLLTRRPLLTLLTRRPLLTRPNRVS